MTRRGGILWMLTLALATFAPPIKDMNSMEVTRYLGTAWKQPLPVFHGPPGADAPPLRRLLLPQGELAQLHDAGDPIQYIAYIQLKEGAARGNHYHKFKQEYIYILEGEALLDLEDVQTKARDSIPVQPGDLVFLPTGIAHAIRVLKSGHALEFSPSCFDPADIHRYTVGLK